MNKKHIEIKVKNLVVDHLGIDLAVRDLHPDDDLILDHNADDLDLIALAMALEDEFLVKISDERLQANRTLAKCIKLVKEGLSLTMLSS